MTNAKNTKRALLLSVLSLMLCAAMLVGSTFAWFTDSVTSGKNKIVAGNLDVELEYSTDGEEWNPVGADTNLFKPADETLWEPGHTEYVYLRVRNAGSLALKYQFAVNVYGDENGGEEKSYTNKDGNPFKLSENLVFTQTDGAETVTDRKSLWIANAEEEKAAMGKLDDLGMTGVLLPEGKGTDENPTEKTLTLAVYMPTQVGNEANQLTSAKADEGDPTIFLGLNLVATQTPFEEDSFGADYDQGAFFPTDKDAVAAGRDVKVNGVYYKDLASAVVAAEPQSTVTLIDSTTVEKSVKLDAEDVLTIDLNGKTMEAPNGTAINMSTGGELTLVNGTVNSKNYAVYAAQDAVIHELNIDMNAGDWGVYLKDNAVLERVTGGTYKSNPGNMASFPLYVSSNAKIEEISGGDFQGSKAAIANYGTIEKISGGTFHGTYYDGTNATIWEPQYSVMYKGTIGSITGGTFFKGATNIAQNMPIFNAALGAGGTTLVELSDTATIVYKKGTNLTEYKGHYYKASKTEL